MTKSLFFLTALILWASTTFASSELLQEFGTASKALLKTQTPYRFMTWNVYKGKKDGLFADYAFFVDNYDFVATQEFLLNEPQMNLIDSKQTNHWAFAKSFESAGGWTGVATVSQWQAMTSVPVRSPGSEPFTGTPKMSLISTFAIEDGRVLMIVNVHGLNFNLMHGAFKKQIDDLIEKVKSHSGPMIMAGDFNTWADTRLKHLIKKTKSIGLTRLDLPNKMGIMNATLDHIFVREVNVTYFEVVDEIQTSDHLPMMMEFNL